LSNSGHVCWCTASPDTIMKLEIQVSGIAKFYICRLRNTIGSKDWTYVVNFFKNFVLWKYYHSEYFYTCIFIAVYQKKKKNLNVVFMNMVVSMLNIEFTSAW
jgi:hypothetical protein